MMQRRQFVKNLVGIFVAAAAPSIFIPSEPVNWKRPKKIIGEWSIELEQDYWAYYSIDIQSELAEQYVYCLNYSKTMDEKYQPVLVGVKEIGVIPSKLPWDAPIKRVEISYI